MQIPGAYPRSDYGGPKHPLDVSSPFQQLDEAQLLDTLNSAPPPIMGALRPLVRSSGETLRSWVDLWLQSGRQPNGVDDPRARTFDGNGITELHRAVQGVRVSWVPFGNCLVPLVDDPQKGQRPGDNHNQAAFLLTLLLASEARFQIAKCRDCMIYFMLPKGKRSYIHGTRCATCRDIRRDFNIRSTTSKRRGEAEGALHRIVAQRFGRTIMKNQTWHRDEVLVWRIVECLNAEIVKKPKLKKIYFTAPRRGVTKKWVTRNRERIAALVSASEKTTKASIQGPLDAF